MNRKKNMKKYRIKWVPVFVTFFIVCIIIVLIFMLFNKGNDNSDNNVIYSVSKYGYIVNSDDSALFKIKFAKLKKVLQEEDINVNEYVSLISELFVIDFYSLDSKYSKNDVGGVQFVYSSYRTSFVDMARDKFYKYIDNNLDGNRKQKLPNVKDTTVNSVKEVSVSKYLDLSDYEYDINKAYLVDISWEYDIDLGYQDSFKLLVVNDNNNYSIAKIIDK